MAERTVKQEMAIGRQHAPAVAWPTLILLAGVYAGLAISTWLALSGALPYWAAGIANGIILYGTYTVVHEGVHDNIVPREKRWRWVNMTAAFLAAIPLWLLIHPHRKSHMVHHARCNTDDDPDIYARGNFGVVTFWRIPLAALSQLNPVEQYRHCKQFGCTEGETRFAVATFAAYVLAVAAIVHAGYGYALLVLWFIPFMIGYSIMLVFFTWVPHHPHTQTGRYRDTRCSLWTGGNLLTQGQNYHLIHHMMPWIPWYEYEAVYKEIAPYLKQHHALIDGFWPQPLEAHDTEARAVH